MEQWHRIAELADRQYGVVTRAQALEAGVAPTTLFEHAHRMRWRRPHPGVFTLPGSEPSFAQRALAASFAAGAPCAVTGAAALHLLGVMRRPPGTVVLLVPARHSLGDHQPCPVIRTTTWDERNLVHVGPLQVAKASRALADHARHVHPAPLGRLVATGCALRRTTLAACRDELERRRRFPGRSAFRAAVMMLTGEMTHSGTERRGRAMLRAVGIEVASGPYPVEHDGRVIAEIDIAVPWALYGIEVDGPHHDLPAQAAADKQRDRQLRRLGWTVDRFPVELIEQTRSSSSARCNARWRRCNAARDAWQPHVTVGPRDARDDTAVTIQRRHGRSVVRR